MLCPHCGNEISEKDVMPVVISTGEEFEQFLCDKINSQDGMRCAKTQASGDQGVDLIVSLANKKIAIQCKLYSQPVGNSAVQEVLAGKILYKCDEACVVTNNIFTSSARQLAAAANVVLLSYKNVLSYLVGIKEDVDKKEAMDNDWNDLLRRVKSGNIASSGGNIARSETKETREFAAARCKTEKCLLDNLTRELNKEGAAAKDAFQHAQNYILNLCVRITKSNDVSPSATTFAIMAIMCQEMVKVAEESSLIDFERWLRFCSLFFELAGCYTQSDLYKEKADKVHEDRKKNTVGALIEDVNVPSNNETIQVIASFFCTTYYRDLLKFKIRHNLEVDRNNITTEEARMLDANLEEMKRQQRELLGEL